MIASVSTLLREFPKVRRAVLSGEDVLVKTREGMLRITKDKPAGAGILGRCRGLIASMDDTLDEPTTSPDEWLKPS
jgi:hypothetical protein